MYLGACYMLGDGADLFRRYVGINKISYAINMELALYYKLKLSQVVKVGINMREIPIRIGAIDAGEYSDLELRLYRALYPARISLQAICDVSRPESKASKAGPRDRSLI